MTTPAEDSRRFPTRGRPLVAFLDGWNRTLHAPAVTIGLLLTTMFWAVLQSYAGPMLMAWNPVDEFARQLMSGHAVLADYGLWLQGAIDNGRDVAMAIGCAVVGVFFSGGIVDRLARARPVGSAAFFSACGGYAGRLLRLTAPFAVIYWFLLQQLRSAVPGSRADLWVVALLCAVTLVHDFARVRLIVEDRRSAIGAVSASLRFIRRRFWRVAVLYLINFIAWMVIFQTWLSAGVVAARAEWLAALVGLLGLLFHTWLYMSCAASEVAFFQAELAHAGYSARPLPMWPDSPSAEGLRNLVGQQGPQS